MENNSLKEPKTVSIFLSSPQKDNKARTLSPKEQTFNTSLSKLKKTFGHGPQLYDHIRFEHEKKVKAIQKEKEKQSILEKELLADNQDDHPKLNEDELNLCKHLFHLLDKTNKKYVVFEDLEQEIESEEIRNILKLVFNRKKKNSLFDFIMALWDSSSLPKLIKHYNDQF